MPQCPRPSCVWGLVILGLAILPTTPGVAQEVYSPDHPEVRALAEGGVAFIQKGQFPKKAGEKVIAALAICECAKRYQGTIPNNNRLVVAAIEAIRNEMFSNGRVVPQGGDTTTMYAPCLAVILLCLVDSEQYETEINTLLQFIYDRQLPGGSWGYAGQTVRDLGDTSQIQYVCLALWMAQKSGIQIDTKRAKRALDWLMDTQMAGGWWTYRAIIPADPRNNRGASHSIAAAGLGSVYMLSHVLDASSVLQSAAKRRKKDGDLPRSVVEYVADDPEAQKEIELRADINQAKLRTVTQRGNQWFASNFTASSGSWPFYYLYGFERYAYFRESAEGSFPDIPDWYDQGVEFLKAQKKSGGNWESTGGIHSVEDKVTTAFAVLFLVRSTELLAGDPRGGALQGGQGFGKGELRVRSDGSVVGREVEKSVTELLRLLDENPDMDLDDYTSAMTKLVVSGDKEQQRKTIDTMRSWISDYDVKRRFIAVKILSLSRDLDSVPALIFAVGDPHPEVATLAHDGLRFISRKIDSIRLPKNPTPSSFNQVKKEWEAWYLKARPNGRLYRESDGVNE